MGTCDQQRGNRTHPEVHQQNQGTMKAGIIYLLWVASMAVALVLI